MRVQTQHSSPTPCGVGRRPVIPLPCAVRAAGPVLAEALISTPLMRGTAWSACWRSQELNTDCIKVSALPALREVWTAGRELG